MNYSDFERIKHTRYSAPSAEEIIIENEVAFLASGGNDDDNEHTGEEDLF